MPRQDTPRKTPAQQKSFPPETAVDFLRSIETCTHGLEFMSDPQLNELPSAVAMHIEEIEDLLCRLSSEATAVLFELGHLPFIAARGRK